MTGAGLAWGMFVYDDGYSTVTSLSKSEARKERVSLAKRARRR